MGFYNPNDYCVDTSDLKKITYIFLSPHTQILQPFFKSVHCISHGTLFYQMEGNLYFTLHKWISLNNFKHNSILSKMMWQDLVHQAPHANELKIFIWK